jgi:phosphatidylserine/phosphatidylglycerophosphate/cardiolipin synthase-like enzyme
MPKITAIANNDVAVVSWLYEQPINKCLGFAVSRIEQPNGNVEVLPAWVGFEGDAVKGKRVMKTTKEWPVQKFVWRDFTASRGQTYQYRVIPMIGTSGKLSEAPANLQLLSDPITLTPRCEAGFQAFFNRGIISTQAIANDLPKSKTKKTSPDLGELKRRIPIKDNETRLRLAGQIIEGVTQLLHRAKQEGGECFLALYELTDPELIQLIIDSKAFVRLILSNADSSKTVNQKQTKVVDGENKPHRKKLHDAGVTIIDRILTAGSNPIGHNKFCVYVKDGTAKAVLLGSTNWTPNGLCAQSNNALVIESVTVATHYLDYWRRLETDTKNKEKERQALKLRNANNQSFPGVAAGANSVDVWFSPNTQWVVKNNAKRPGDMGEVFEAILAAKRAVLFLAFKPGNPNVVDAITAAFVKTPTLFIRGAVTDAAVAIQAQVNLFHRAGEAPDQITRPVIPASAVKDSFEWWVQELLSAGNAIIHDKVVVVDPFEDECVVVTGSHNQGYKASSSNDENMVIIRGNKALAAAYTTHILDRYDHYRWRFSLQQSGNKAYQGLKRDMSWQTKYFAHGMDEERKFLFRNP